MKKLLVGYVLPYSLTLVLLLGLWELGSRLINPLFFPSLTTVWESFIRMVLGDLLLQTGVSLVRILTGFMIGSLLGVFLGLWMGGIPIVRSALSGIIEFFRFIPPIAMIVLAVSWFGTGNVATIFLIVFATIFIVTINTQDGISHVIINRIRAAQMQGASSWQVFRIVILPSTMPHALTGMRIAMGNAFSTVIAAEMIAAHFGLGFMLQQARVFLKTGDIFVGLVMLGLLGFLTDRVFRLLISRYGGEYAVVR
jgi:NitT/TauT family transport system permease protein